VIEEAKMVELRGELAAQRDNLRREITEQGGNPDVDEAEIDVERGFADSAHSTAERARLLSVMKALRANLRWVNRALTKIELGTYGVCERCGRPISVERLEALPWAILCIDCKRVGEGR
jgi:RNA polymerase-binding transcription factor